ncbi:unnamed protein product [Cylicocyclus nassatus]|uniref:Uncharacterized protein n=1 Tax=Cylicocyclus nassatus TaxID=53992 RepID=A0AA36DRD9_CYLNA|nr:unnamed protein product [Cylicocyclus nassatus]
MSHAAFLTSVTERKNRTQMDFHNMPAMHDSDVQLSVFNVVSACIVALLLTAVIIILVVAYIRAKSRGATKSTVSSSVTVESYLESMAINNNNNISSSSSTYFTNPLYACTNNQNHYDSIVSV